MALGVRHAGRDIGEQKSKIQQLLVYVPAAPPVSEHDLCRDPFAAIAAAGALFPDGEGDTYVSLCHKAKPEHRAKIDQLFAEGEPDFAVIDALDGGAGWPRLQSMLDVESPTEILTSLLSPDEVQFERMKADTAWIGEAKEFLQAGIGFKPKTKTSSWSVISDEIWRFTLFSEFFFDLPGEAPESIAQVPKAEPAAIDLVNRVCEILRSSAKHEKIYLENAARIAAELDLEARMGLKPSMGEHAFAAALVPNPLESPKYPRHSVILETRTTARTSYPPG